MTDWPVYGTITGPIVMVGFGSIGKGTLPLIERHLNYDKSRVTVLDPKDEGRKALCDKHNVRFIQKGLTKDNYRELLTPLLTEGGGQGFCVNLSVDTGSVDIMELCNEIGALYIDTVNEPWLGFYFDASKGAAARSNYALRETTLTAKKARRPGSTTAVSCCGANPGMVSFFAKQALVNLAADLKLNVPEPKTKAEWADLMRQAGVKGIHIAERDTQRSKKPKPPEVFVNTWSVEGFLSEGMQPAELGWGTHEKWMPENAHTHEAGCGAAIYLMQPGANTRVRTWCPTRGSQYGFLVTHNESISISDYFTAYDASGKATYRPTCHYAYHPADDAVLSLHELFGRAGKMQEKHHILDENEIVDGIDELGVLLYGHGKNAYWFGSQLSIEETRDLAPYQNATGLQVTSAVLGGMVWALEHPNEGIVEADEMDFHRLLEIQLPYLGPVKGYYTDWTPLAGRPGLFPEELDTNDPWQFKNVLVR
jgi:homospermidine synthase